MMEAIRTTMRRHSLYLLKLSIAAALGTLLVFISAVVKQSAVPDRPIGILHIAALLIFTVTWVVMVLFGVLLSPFFIGVLGSLFGIIDFFLASPLMGIWKAIPGRWEHGQNLLEIDDICVFFFHTMATCLWPLHLCRLINIPTWSHTFEALTTSFITNYTNFIHTAHFTVIVIAVEALPICASTITLV